LWSARASLTAIHVYSEEPFIPWELVHLKPPAQDGPQRLPADVHFLGQKGLVRWFHNQGNPPLEIRVRSHRFLYAIPDYPHPDYRLEAAQEEIPFLENLGAQPVQAEPNVLRDLIQKPGRLDLFHFSGHGEADPGKEAAARILMTGRIEGKDYIPEYLRSEVVAQYGNLVGADGSRPLIVLNACQAGRVGWQLTSIGGFAEAFVRAGAG